MRTHWCVGGLAGGKSHGAQIWDIWRCLENGVPLREAKPSVSWTVAPNYRICETLLELTLQVAYDVFRMEEGVHYDLRRAFPRSIDFRRCGRNHRMVFLSASNPEHFVSSSLTHWRWSEVGVSKKEVLDKIRDRLRDKRGKVLQGLADGSPEGYNHFYDWAGFIGTERDAVDEARNFRVYRVETADNVKNLAPGYLESLEARYSYAPHLLDSYARGIFTDHRAANSAFHCFSHANNLHDRLKPSPYLPIELGWDFNVGAISWVASQQITTQRDYYSPREKKTVALRESSGDSRGLYDACLEFAVWFPVAEFRNTLIRIDGDCSGWAGSHKVDVTDYAAIEEYLTTLGYRNIEVIAPRQNPRIRVRLEKVNALFAYRMAAVTPDCPRLLESLTKTTLKEGTWDIEKPSGEKHTHAADAWSYSLLGIYGDEEITNPRGSNKPLGGTL